MKENFDSEYSKLEYLRNSVKYNYEKDISEELLSEWIPDLLKEYKLEDILNNSNIFEKVLDRVMYGSDIAGYCSESHLAYWHLAQCALLHNGDLMTEALDSYYDYPNEMYTFEEIARTFLNPDWIDCRIREYLVPKVLRKVLTEIKNDEQKKEVSE